MQRKRKRRPQTNTAAFVPSTPNPQAERAVIKVVLLATGSEAHRCLLCSFRRRRRRRASLSLRARRGAETRPAAPPSATPRRTARKRRPHGAAGASSRRRLAARPRGWRQRGARRRRTRGTGPGGRKTRRGSSACPGRGRPGPAIPRIERHKRRRRRRSSSSRQRKGQPINTRDHGASTLGPNLSSKVRSALSLTVTA